MNEEDKKIIKMYLDLQGSKEYTSAYFKSRDFKTLTIRFCTVELDEKIKDNYSNILLAFNDIDDIKKAGKEIIEKHTNGIDRKILYSRQDYLTTKLLKNFGENPKEEEYIEIYNFIKENAERIDVIDIPITYNVCKNENGKISHNYFYDEEKVNQEFYKNLPNVISDLELNGKPSNIMKYIYIHEMYHALELRNKGTIINYLNDEFIPIFMEKVAASEIDPSRKLLDKETIRRLNIIKDEIFNKMIRKYHNQTNLSDVMDEKYILSTLEAVALFNTYDKSNKIIKDEINKDINTHILGDLSSEDIIDKYEAYPEKGTKIVKKQLKKYYNKKA